MSLARTLDDLDFKPKLILGVEGERGSGKTALGLSAAMVRPPLTHMRWDFASTGALRAIRKAGLNDSVTIRDYIVDLAIDMEKQAFEAKKLAAELKKNEGRNSKAMAEAIRVADAALAGVKSNAEEVYDDFLADYKEALTLGGTVLIDTGMELYQAVRLSIFGLLRQVPQMQYEKTNKIMMDLMAMAEGAESNLIFINKLRDDWQEGSDGKRHMTGKMIPDGWKELEWPAHVMVRTYREGTKSDPTRDGPVVSVPGAFCFQFTKCNDKEIDDLTGTCHQVGDPMMGFDQIGRLVFGEDWDQ